MKKYKLLLATSLAALATASVSLVSCGAATYAISAESKVSNATITVDKEKLDDKETVNVTLTNNRASTIVDANVSIIIGENHVNIPLDEGLTTEGKTLSFTKDAIQEKFTDYKIKGNDQIKFLLVRSGAYEVKENQLYQYNDFGDSTLVSDEQLNPLITAKTFLVKDTDSDDLIVSKKTFPEFIDSCNVADATRDLYFVGGEFFNEGHGAPAPTTLNIHGLLRNNKKTITAGLRVYRDYVSQEYNEGLNAGNIKFNLDNLIVQGRDGLRESGRNDYQEGMMCPNLNATNCYFTGAYTLWYGHSVFNNCTFDSRNTYKMAGTNTIKNNYPMYLYAGSTAEFKDCTFESIGKSLKVYSDGPLTKDLDVFSLDNCKFNLYAPSIKGHSAYTMEEVESPINIDASMSKTCDYKYKATINSNCSVNQYWIDQKSGVANNKLYWAISIADPNETTVARNILINGEKIAPDQQPNY